MRDEPRRTRVRRWVFWRLYNAVEVLDGVVGRLDRLIAPLEPKFVPTPLPEPHYDNHTERCEDCGGYLAIPIQSDWSEATRSRWIDSAQHVHAMRCAATSENSALSAEKLSTAPKGDSR